MKKAICNAVHRRMCHQGGAHVNVHGFTLVELMIVLVIVAVILMIAAPSYSILIQRTKLKSYANEVVASIYLARSEAIKRNSDMKLCVSNNGTSCTGGGSWEQGWIVVMDDPNGPVVKHQQALSSGIILFELASFSTITFQPSGVVSPSATLKLCQQTPSVGIEEKLVTVSVTGRPRIQTKTDGCP